MTFRRRNDARPPLDKAALERLALAYAGRYATSRAKLSAYLMRKIGERGWGADEAPPVDVIVARFAELGYVDDRAVAESRGRALAARGYGARRVGQALHMLGIEAPDADPVRRQAEEDAWRTALDFARRRRFGPFAVAEADESARRRAFGAMIRAGHSPDTIKQILACKPGFVPDQDDIA